MENNNVKFENWYEKKATFLVFMGGTIISMVLAVYIPMWGMKTDIALIKQEVQILETNHIKTIQDDIKEISTNLKIQNETIIKLIQLHKGEL